MKVTIGKKIASLIVVMAVLIGISGIVAIANISKVGRNADVIMQEAEIVDSIQEARISFQQLLMPPNDYLITGREEEKEHFEKLLKLTKDNLARCDTLLQGHEHYVKLQVDDNTFLSGIETDLAAIEHLSHEIFSMAEPLKHKNGNIMEEMDNTAYKVTAELDRLEVLTQKLFDPELTDAIHELNLSFHQLLMPTNDFLITGNINEIEHFDELLSKTKAQLIGVSSLLTNNKEQIAH